MPISRSQMERQLRMGGGIMGLEPRQEYGLGSIVKSVKKAVSGAAKGIKSLAKSDVGKIGLLLGGGYLAGGGTFFGKGLPFLKTGAGGFSMGNLGTNLGLNNILSKGTGMSGLTKGLLTGGALASIFASQGISDEQAEEIKQNPVALRGYLTQYFQNLYPKEDVSGLVETNMAEYKSNGGRIGAMYGGRMKYGDGTPYVEPDPAMMVDTTTFNPIPENADRQEAAEIAKVMMATRGLPREEGEIEDTETMSTEDFMLNEYFKPKREELMENFGLSLEEANNLIREEAIKIRGNNAKGGRIGYAYGSDEIVDQASGIMGLPKRTNKAGVKELDLRDSGGFIPPVGVKEKADDIPAMLSNNEFVFTADAVRGMGDGNVNKGAQRMYDMMKKLENGGKV